MCGRWSPPLKIIPGRKRSDTLDTPAKCQTLSPGVMRLAMHLTRLALIDALAVPVTAVAQQNPLLDQFRHNELGDDRGASSGSIGSAKSREKMTFEFGTVAKSHDCPPLVVYAIPSP